MNVCRIFLMIMLVVVMERGNYLKVDALEATFTHADGEEGRPLPLSQNLRDQISQLDQIISSSENPQETLMKVAQSNNMNPEELVQMINANRRDQAMTQVKSSPSRKLFSNAFQLLFVMPFRTIPARYWVLLLVAIFLTIQAPRTGIPLPSSSMSGGWTTVFEPPTPYLHSCTEQHFDTLFDHSLMEANDGENTVSQRLQALLMLQNNNRNSSLKKNKKKQTKKKKNKSNDDDGVHVYKELCISVNEEEETAVSKKKKKSKKKESDVSQTQDLICAKYTVDLRDMISMLDKDITEKEENDEQLHVHVALSQFMTAANTIITGRRFSEYVSSSHKTSIVTSQDDEDAALWILPQMGTLNRFAIQPFFVISEHVDEKSSAGNNNEVEIDDSRFISYTFNDGNKQSIFDDGTQLDICCTWTKDDVAQVRVTLAIPNESNMILSDNRKTKLLSKSIDELCQSITKSIALQAKQNLSRKMQSRSFRTNARARALEKRNIRQEKLVALEEMNEKRRRRWQRNNPDAGHYRPSGIRMQSPNNC